MKRPKRLLLILIAVTAAAAFGWWVDVRMRQERASQQLVQAVMEGNTERVASLLNDGADPDMRAFPPNLPGGFWARVRRIIAPGKRESRQGTDLTMVLVALESRKIEIARKLIEYGADPNTTDSEGQTPLYWAIGHPDLVRLLLAKGARAHVYDHEYQTPLTMAVIGDDYESARLLLEAGVKPNAKPLEPARDSTAVPPAAGNASGPPGTAGVPSWGSGGTPPWASSAGPPESQQDPVTERARHDFLPPLTHALELGRTRIAGLLLTHGAQLPADPDERYALMVHACSSGSAETVKLLLDHGFDADTAHSIGITPLMYSAGSGIEPQVLQLLIARGARLDRRDDRFKWTPLEWAVHGEPMHRKDPNNRFPSELQLYVAHRMEDRSRSDPLWADYVSAWSRVPQLRRIYFSEDIRLLSKPLVTTRRGNR